MLPLSRRAAAALISATEAAGFRIFLDDACGMPADWRHPAWELVANASNAYISKYGAEFLLPRMLDASPFVTRDWRRANASLVVLFGNKYGGPFAAPERCRRILSERSSVWRATGGARHFFIVPSDFGPCSHSGHMVSAGLLRHCSALTRCLIGVGAEASVAPQPRSVPERDADSRRLL